MHAPPRWLSAAVVAGLVLYLVAFFAWPLPAEGPAAQAGWRRYHLAVLLVEPEALAEDWFGRPAEFALADRLPVAALAGAIFAWAALLGRLLLKCLGADNLPRPERFLFSAAAGLNLLSTWTLLCGLAGLLQQGPLIVLPAAATLAVAAWASWPRRKATAAGPGPAPPAPRGQPPRPDSSPMPSKPGPSRELLSAGWLCLAAPLVAVILLGGMLPPIEFDVREYHLQAPKEFFQQGHIGFVPHNLYANMALGTEMLSLLAMVLARDWWTGALVGKTLVALYAPMGGLALWAIGRQWFSQSAGVVAAVLYLSSGWIVQVSTLGMVEGASALYLLLATYAVLRSLEPARADLLRTNQARPTSPCAPPCASAAPRAAASSPGAGPHCSSKGWLFLGGYCAGAAVATKYPAVLFVVLPLTAGLSVVHLRRSPRGAWKPLALFLGACTLGCGLWFAKNAVLAGNPTYPLMYNLFGGRTWTPEKNALWNQVHLPHDFSPRRLISDLLGVYLGSAWLGPLLMPLATLALLVRRHRRLAGVLAGYFGLVILAWWLTALRIDRYWIPALPLVALLAGLGATWQTARWWRRTFIALLATTSLYNFIVATAGFGGYNRFFVSYARLRDDPARVQPWHRYLNRHARDGRVLLVGDAQVFDLEMPVLYNTWLDDCLFERLIRGRTPQEIHQALCGRGITHVFVHWDEIERYRRTGYGQWDFVQPAVFQELVHAGVLEPLPKIPGERSQAYRVRPGPAER